MKEYNGRINVSKDTMLFVTNYIFGKNIKANTTKEDILKMMPDIYKEADDKKIIEMLPYKAYKELEELIEYLKTNDDIESFYFAEKRSCTHYLEETMIIVMRLKNNVYNYSINPGVMENLEKIFSKENKKIAKRYGDIEKLIIGMLYSYGVVDFEFFKKQLCKYMNEKISEEELSTLFVKRLNLNILVKYCNIKWTNINQTQFFVTYLDEDEIPIDIGEIAEEQKRRNMRYKEFTKEEILNRKEYLWDNKTQKLYKFLKPRCDYLFELTFERMLKRNELGIDILKYIADIAKFDNEKILINLLNYLWIGIITVHNIC